MPKVFYTFYFIIAALLLMVLLPRPKEEEEIILASEFKSRDSIVQHTESPVTSPVVSFGNLQHDTLCLRDSLLLTDKTGESLKRICYWGDGDSMIYYNDAQITHKYLSTGIKLIQIVYDGSYTPIEKQVKVTCIPDPYLAITDQEGNTGDFHASNQKPLTLTFESGDQTATWKINNQKFEFLTIQEIRKPGTLQVKYVAGDRCGCDSSMTLVINSFSNTKKQKPQRR